MSATVAVVAAVAGIALASLSLAAFPSPASAADDGALTRRLMLCAGCHGQEGNSTSPQYPILAGQPALYTFLRLKQLQGRIDNPEMTPVAKLLEDGEIDALAQWFAKRTPRPGLATFDAGRATAGHALAVRLGCAQCHREDYAGGDQIPRLAGQHVPYLVAQMQLIRENRRSDDNGNMVDMLRRISPRDVEDLAHFFASVK